MKTIARCNRALRIIAYAAITPLLEKNVLKTMTLATPVVFSMSRLIVLAFAIAMLYQIRHAGIAGWPDATLSISIVLGLPIVGALERMKPESIAEIVKVLLARFGEGATRRMGSVYGTEPSKFDDHRDD